MPLNALPPVLPGIYPGAGQASLLRANSQQFLIQNLAKATLVGQASIAVQLERIKMSYYYPFGVSIQVWFTDVNGVAAAPGAFEVDAQTSDNDVQYSDAQGLTAVNSTSQAGRIELPWLWAKFIRVRVPTLTNAVFANVLVTR